MAEANYHGKASSAHWGLDTGDTVAALAALTNVINWTVNLTCETAESSVMHATAHGKQRETGFKNGTASVTCHISGDFEIDEGDEGSLQLMRTALNADKGYAFGVVGAAGKGAICTGVDTGVDKDGIETVTYNFVSTGLSVITSTCTEGT